MAEPPQPPQLVPERWAAGSPPLHKVRRGDPLEIPAGTFNTFIDVARDFRQRQLSQLRHAEPDVRRSGIVLVKNETGQDCGRFNVLGLSGVIIKPTDNPDDFQQRVALRGTIPAAQHKGRFAVLLEPLRDGEIGRAILDGLTAVRVEMLNEEHPFADIREGYCDVLQSGSSGSAQLLWVQPENERDDPAIAWAVARIGPPQSTGLQIARLADFYYDPQAPTVAVAFLGFFVNALGEPNPDPLPAPEEMTVFWPFRWPWIVAPTNDMRYVLPGVPFLSEDGYSDVLVAQFGHHASGETRWYIVTPHFVGVCI